MNQELIDMAEKAGIAFSSDEYPDIWSTYMHVGKEEIEDFAALVAAAEREACARVCEEPARKWWSIHCHSNKHAETTRKAHDDFCALQRAIRARGKA
jgi:hypothetical protein